MRTARAMISYGSVARPGNTAAIGMTQSYDIHVGPGRGDRVRRGRHRICRRGRRTYGSDAFHPQWLSATDFGGGVGG
jgi:hypothetical protein